MIWGETGSREGATHRQIASTAYLWAKHGITELHDGDCVGVDTQLYWLACSMLVADIVVHPPINIKFRSGCGMDEAFRPSIIRVHLREPRGYHERDRDVVNESEVVVGLPFQNVEHNVGGTWYTINYAREQKKPLAIVWPDGHIQRENWTLDG